MAEVHGRQTILTVAAQDISAFCKTSTFGLKPDIHDRTGYGATHKRKSGGLIEGTFSVSGVYDNTALTGPGNSLKPIVGTTVPVVRKLEGNGTGKPQETFSAVVGNYVETSPHDDLVTWSCDFEMDGSVTKINQV